MIQGRMQESATNDELVKGKHRSFSPRQAQNVMRECALGYDRVFANYFANNFTYSNLHF